MWVAADKSNNYYRIDVHTYTEFLEKEIHKDYRKVGDDYIHCINSSHRNIVRELELSDRVFTTAEREAFCTLKDHKENFWNNPRSRLLNPTKPELGRISKLIIEKINNSVRSKTGLRQ